MEYNHLFLNECSMTTLKDQLEVSLSLINTRLKQNNPISNTGREELLKKLSTTQSLPTQAKESFNEVANNTLQPLLAHLINVNHVKCVAHLHCPPLITSISAELLIAAFNVSMDSWDQSGIATLIEEQVIDWIISLLSYSHYADGVFTSGGTQSNLMGVLLARESYAEKNNIKPLTETGLQGGHKVLTILCTRQAHFSVTQAARWLGIGSDNVITIDLDNIEKTFTELAAANRCPFVLMATAGCTDFGRIDPLLKIRAICDKYHLWMHVDAAVGGALLLTNQKERLIGLEKSDSITIDFHKLFFQPISASVFMLKNKNHFKFINFFSEYLNREIDEQTGTINLVGKSLQTTRRFDALKVWLTWQHLGIETIQGIIENILARTQEVAKCMTDYPELELAALPTMNTIIFRYISKVKYDQNKINHRIRKVLFDEGQAVIGQTKVNNNIYLKFTLMNPMLTRAHFTELLETIVKQGRLIEEK